MELFSIAFVQAYGYLAVLLLGFLSSVSLFLPTPAFAIVFAISAPQFGLSPLLVGLLAGVGAAAGELVGYVVGYGSSKILERKYKKTLDRIEKAFQKHGAPLVIFVFAATPLPFDLVGIFCGTIKYDYKKFFLATLAGKVLKYLVIAYAGFYGVQWVSDTFGL